MLKTTMIRFACVAALMVLSGCHTFTAPPNFMPVDRSDQGDYDQRMISADGVVIGLRSQRTHTAGTLAFWSQAITNELVNTKGYQLVESGEEKAANGRTCRLMTFTYSLRGNGMTYLLAVHVDGREVLLAEAGGKSDLVQKQLPDIRKSLLSAR